MASKISEIQKHKLMKLNGKGVRIERGHSTTYVVYGLRNATEPRANSLDEAIEIAEKYVDVVN